MKHCCPLKSRLMEYQQALLKLCGEEKNFAGCLTAFETQGNGAKKQTYLEEFSAYFDKTLSELEKKYASRSYFEVNDKLLVDGKTAQELRESGFQKNILQKIKNEETRFNALYLRTLSRMLAEEGYDASAEQLYRNETSLARFYGSQHILLTKDFTAAKNTEVLKDSRIGPNESITQYEFEYGLTQNFVDKVLVRAPRLVLDVKAVNLLRAFGIGEDEIKQYGENLIKMANLAGHDYLHQMVLPYTDPDLEISKGFIHNKSAHTGNHLEDHALALHSQILERLFKEEPKRKTLVIGYALETFEQLHEMQEHAWKKCKDDSDKKKVDEVITYLAEVYCHRFFRVISPKDSALRPSHIEGSRIVRPKDSVEVAADRLTLIHSKNKKNAYAGDNLELLDVYTSRWLGSVYTATKRLNNFPARTFAQSLPSGGWNLAKSRPVETELPVTALEFMDRLNKDVAASKKKPKDYLKDAKKFADNTRESMRLRKEVFTLESEGKDLEAQAKKAEALRIERQRSLGSDVRGKR